uniref:C-CAP/cofactor C-like domain-containing protein n=1 Tax=Steinernema glaseri TaxID=37863 RepID=A0A1I7ZK14_9BILA
MTTPSDKADDARRQQQGESGHRSKLYGDLSESSDSSSLSSADLPSGRDESPTAPPVAKVIPLVVEHPPSPAISSSSVDLPSSASSSRSQSPDLFERRSPLADEKRAPGISDKFTDLFSDDHIIEIEEDELIEEPGELVKEKISEQSTNSSEGLRYSRTATEEIFSEVEKNPGYFSNIDLDSPSDSIHTTVSVSEAPEEQTIAVPDFNTVHQIPPKIAAKLGIITTQPLPGGNIPVPVEPPPASSEAPPLLSGIMTKLCCFRKKSRNQEYQVPDENPQPQFSWEQPNRPDPRKYRFVNQSNTILVKRDGDIAGQQFTVDNCKNCTILLFDWSASITIDECENCLFVIGPCTGSVFVRTTKECTILAISQQFRTRDCSSLALFLFCVTQPTIEESLRIQFSPLFLYYDSLESQLRQAGLSPFNNNWNRVHDFSADNRSNYETVSEGPLAVPHIAEAVGTCGLNVDNATSVLISCTNRIYNGEKAMVLCTKNPEEELEAFYSRTVKLTHMLSEQLQLLDCRDIKIKKGELKSLFNTKTFAKYTGQMVVLEFEDSNAAEKIKDHVGPGVYLVEQQQAAEYGRILHRFSEVQGTV